MRTLPACYRVYLGIECSFLVNITGCVPAMLLCCLFGCYVDGLDSSSCIQDTRLEDYRNYLNLKDEVDAHQDELYQECLVVQKVSVMHVPPSLL